MLRAAVQCVAGAGLLALCATAGAWQEPQGVPRTLIDRKLQERAIQLTTIDTRSVTYIDIAGLVRHEPVTEYLALTPPSPADLARRAAQLQSTNEQATSGPDGKLNVPVISTSTLPARPVSLLVLADGQRFSGVIAPTGTAVKDVIRWSHPVLGILEFKLEQVRRAQINSPGPDGPTATPPAQNDAVIFANGDRIEGFVESIASDKLEFGIGDKGEVRTIELGVVREILFANPPQPLPARSMMLWLRDGSVIASRGIQTNRMGELLISPALRETDASPSESSSGTPGLRLDDLLAAAFEDESLVPLAALPPLRQSPEGERRWTAPITAIESDRAVLGAADIQVPGPMSVEWELPAGASRFATEAELPRPMWTWGDCDLVVTVAIEGGESELFRRRINADQPRVRLSVALGDPAASKRLRIRVEPGAYGAVQDQIVLHRPLLLIEKKPG
jgi:hypothetical protein